jgi:type II secretory pathway component HofQ
MIEALLTIVAVASAAASLHSLRKARQYAAEARASKDAAYKLTMAAAVHSTNAAKHVESARRAAAPLPTPPEPTYKEVMRLARDILFSKPDVKL